MRQNYFIHNGKQYNAGESIVIGFYNLRAGCTCKTDAKFLYYDTATMEYHVEIDKQEYVYDAGRFYKNLYSETNPRAPTSIATNINHKEYTFANELGIDGLFIAWIWYVFIMVVGAIFYDRIGIWILASVIFFDYRNKKLKEAGYK